MARVIIPVDNLTPLMSDASRNQFYALWVKSMMFATFNAKDADDSGRKRPPEMKMNQAETKVVVRGVDESDLPTIARMVALHDLTAGEMTVQNYNLFIGLTAAKLAQDCELVSGKKWQDIITPRYPGTVIATRTWISSGAIDPQGLSIANIKTLQAATGIQLNTIEQYRAILPVTPLP